MSGCRYFISQEIVTSLDNNCIKNYTYKLTHRSDSGKTTSCRLVL
jgi:hypothetical protein